MWEASDEALLAGLGTGDGAAALVFVRRFQRRVFGLAQMILSDRCRAEDAAQEVFVRAWRHAAAYDARRGTVATWLLAITRNVAIDALRVERARPADLVAGPGLTVADHGPGPDDLAAQGDAVTRVAAALGRLPAEQRRALVAAALYGRTGREISDDEGIPLGTAKTRLRTAVLRLRDELVPERAE